MHGVIGTMKVMDPTGHSTISWDSNISTEVEAARAMYTTLVDRGYQAFRVGKSGQRGERITSFDPHAEEVIMVPQMVGG